MAMGWTAGLHWTRPMEHGRASGLTPAEYEAMTAEIAVLNAAAVVVGRAEGTTHSDADGTGQRLADASEERLFSAAFLACAHLDDGGVYNVWNGPFQAVVCGEPGCEERLQHHIAATRWLGHCGLCADRSPRRADEIVDISIGIRSGRLTVPVHDRCLPEAFREAAGL
jgi:hypothetical protein